MLQSAVGWEYQSELSKHGSQVDAAKGFGGKYGVQTDRQDKVGRPGIFVLGGGGGGGGAPIIHRWRYGYERGMCFLETRTNSTLKTCPFTVDFGYSYWCVCVCVSFSLTLSLKPCHP